MLGRVAVVASLAVSAMAQAEEMSLSACAPLVYPAEASRYQVEGTVRLEFALGTDGRATQAHVVQSSGAGVLDRASLAVLESCKFPPVQTSGATVGTLAIAWQLPASSRADRAPAVNPNTCRRGYKVLELVGADDPRRNLSVRVQVWPNGSGFTPRIEQTSGEALADKEALEVAESCDYRPAERGGHAVPGATLLTLSFDRAAIGEEKVRALYDRIAASFAKEKDYKVRHILVSTETAARAILAELNGGADFAAIARKQSLDKPSGKVDGELGWLRPTDTVPEFSRELAAHDKTGLLPMPVHSAFGWHVIEIEAGRPSVIPPYDDEARRLLKQRLIGEREVIVQQPPPIPR